MVKHVLILAINFFISLDVWSMTTFAMPEKFVCSINDEIVVRGAYSTLEKTWLLFSLANGSQMFRGHDEIAKVEYPDKFHFVVNTSSRSIIFVIKKNILDDDSFAAELHEPSLHLPSTTTITPMLCYEHH